MSYEDLQVNTGTWSTSSSTTSTGHANTDDLLNELLQTLGDFLNEMSPLFFLSSVQNLKTAIEDFGQGMSAALACVSIDLLVVASGLSAAAAAYASTDKSIADTFAHLDSQLAYYTKTATSVSFHGPTQAQQVHLHGLSTSSGASSSNWLPTVGWIVGGLLVVGGFIALTIATGGLDLVAAGFLGLFGIALA